MTSPPSRPGPPAEPSAPAPAPAPPQSQSPSSPRKRRRTSEAVGTEQWPLSQSSLPQQSPSSPFPLFPISSLPPMHPGPGVPNFIDDFRYPPLDGYDTEEVIGDIDGRRLFVEGTWYDAFPSTGLAFRNSQEAMNHLSLRRWAPICDDSDVPGKEDDKWPWVQKLVAAFKDLGSVRDTCFPDYMAFRGEFGGGLWTDKEIEAVSHVVLREVIKLHRYGMTSLRFRDPYAMKRVDGPSRDMRFKDRMEHIIFGLRHYKRLAQRTMKGISVDDLIAMPKQAHEHSAELTAMELRKQQQRRQAMAAAQQAGQQPGGQLAGGQPGRGQPGGGQQPAVQQPRVQQGGGQQPGAQPGAQRGGAQRGAAQRGGRQPGGSQQPGGQHGGGQQGGGQQAAQQPRVQQGGGQQGGGQQPGGQPGAQRGGGQQGAQRGGSQPSVQRDGAQPGAQRGGQQAGGQLPGSQQPGAQQ